MYKSNRNLGRDMRAKGLSYGEIARGLGVSNGSVRNWTRDIQLTDEQKAQILIRKYGQSAVDKRKITRAKNRVARESWVRNRAKSEINLINTRDLRMLGLAIYWSEGAKTRRNFVQFSDADPVKIKLMMRFFREICQVPEVKFRGYLSIDARLDEEGARFYWSDITKIPMEQFYKSYAPLPASQTSPAKVSKYGNLSVIINDTRLFLKIMAWLEKVKEISGFLPIRQPIAE